MSEQVGEEQQPQDRLITSVLDPYAALLGPEQQEALAVIREKLEAAAAGSSEMFALAQQEYAFRRARFDPISDTAAYVLAEVTGLSDYDRTLETVHDRVAGALGLPLAGYQKASDGQLTDASMVHLPPETMLQGTAAVSEAETTTTLLIDEALHAEVRRLCDELATDAVHRTLPARDADHLPELYADEFRDLVDNALAHHIQTCLKPLNQEDLYASPDTKHRVASMLLSTPFSRARRALQNLTALAGQFETSDQLWAFYFNLIEIGLAAKNEQVVGNACMAVDKNRCRAALASMDSEDSVGRLTLQAQTALAARGIGLRQDTAGQPASEVHDTAEDDTLAYDFNEAVYAVLHMLRRGSDANFDQAVTELCLASDYARNPFVRRLAKSYAGDTKADQATRRALSDELKRAVDAAQSQYGDFTALP